MPRGWGPRLYQPPRQDMDLAVFNNLDGRRLEVVADGLTLWQGAQLAIDTTLVSPLRRDGSARPRAADHDGAALEEARRRKERTYPELSGDGEGLAWSFLPQRLEAGGASRLHSSWSAWRKLKLMQLLTCCEAGSSRPTSGGGVLSWHVRQFVRSLLPCWTAVLCQPPARSLR